MTEMIERVARALQEGDDAFPSGSPIDPWYRGAAMAAIEVMREPTDEMLDAGGIAFAHYTDKRESIRLWQAMIDAALK